MYLSYVENSRLRALVDEWKNAGSIPQEAFDWDRSRANWQRDLAPNSEFISQLPKEIDRTFLRTLVANGENSVMEKFLAVMIWGYGDLGYGSFRVRKMLDSDGFQEKVATVFEMCQQGAVLDSYVFLSKSKIDQLGPAFGTKIINFFTPREVVAPIYDSFISKWMDIYAKDAFPGGSCSSKVWSRNVYSSYVRFITSHAQKLECFGEDLELVIFRDALAQFETTSRWIGQ